MRSTLNFLLILGFSLASIGVGQSQSAQHPANVIHVEVIGLRSDRGQVSCALYASAEGFPKKPEKAIARVTSAIAQERSVCEFSGIASGTYAISVFHDENSNGKLDTNFVGIPREGVGASNGARGRMGPPKFDAAAFQFAGDQLTLKIGIVYL